MPRRTIAYPPYRALSPPSPYPVGRRGLRPLSRGRRLTWEQQMRRWVARSDPAPAIRRWLAQVSRSLPPCGHRSEGALATVTCALYALEGPAPRLLHLEDIHWREGVRISRVAPLLAPLWDLGPLPARRAGAAAPQPWVDAPQRRALLVEGWDDEAEGSGGH